MLDNQEDPVSKAIQEVEYRVERLESMIKDSWKSWPKNREYDYEDVADKTNEISKAILTALKEIANARYRSN